jgi:hypothetical protein
MLTSMLAKHIAASVIEIRRLRTRTLRASALLAELSAAEATVRTTDL